MVHSDSSTLAAAINLAKLCIGTGILALPYATSRGGLLFGPIALGAVAALNGISCNKMIECKRASEHRECLENISSTYTKIAYFGLGRLGIFVTDFSVIVTLLGVCIACQITFASLLYEIPQVTLSKPLLTLISGIIAFPISCASDVGILSKVSLVGLICLSLGMISIIVYGFWEFGKASETSSIPLVLFPESFSDMTIFIGISTYCYGLCSLAFPVEESMKYKNEFNKAVLLSLIFVWIVYILVGDLGAMLYINDPKGIRDNILSNLPENSSAATLVRISMASVCLLTFPLAFLPPAQMIESIFKNNTCRILTISIGNPYQIISNDEQGEISYSTVVFNRLLLVCFCTFLSTCVPCFGVVVSILGSFTVAILSFILPPWLHLEIISKPALSAYFNSKGLYIDSSELSQLRYSYYEDICLTVFGIILSFISTIVTLTDVYNHFQNGGSC